jgi:hypothetical protein
MARYNSSSQPQYLIDFLDQYTVAQLKQLASLVASGLPNRKADLIDVIHTYLTNPDNLRREWQLFDDITASRHCRGVHSNETRLDTAQFKAKYGQQAGYWALATVTVIRFQTLIDASKFVFLRYSLPLDLKEQLKTFVPPPREVKLKTDDLPETITQTFVEFDYETRKSTVKHTVETPIVRQETERAALQDIFTVLRLIEAGKIRVSNKTFRVSAPGAKVITEACTAAISTRRMKLLDDYDPDAHRPHQSLCLAAHCAECRLCSIQRHKIGANACRPEGPPQPAGKSHQNGLAKVAQKQAAGRIQPHR